jgi:predicted nucleotidyltransferase
VVQGTEEPDSDIDLLIITDRHVDLNGLFEGAEIEFGHAVTPHLWMSDQLRSKRGPAIIHRILKEGQHIRGKELKEMVR